MASKIGGWLLYFAGVAAIIYLGWERPLHYRFLSPQEIQQIEHPSATPAPDPSAMPSP